MVEVVRCAERIAAPAGGVRSERVLVEVQREAEGRLSGLDTPLSFQARGGHRPTSRRERKLTAGLLHSPTRYPLSVIARLVLLTSLSCALACGGGTTTVPVAATVTASESPPEVTSECSPRWSTPADSLGYFVGAWSGQDDLGWGYTLTVSTDGDFTLVVDQVDEGTTCTVQGSLYPDAAELVFVVGENGCAASYSGETLRSAIVEPSDTSFGVEFGDYFVLHRQ